MGGMSVFLPKERIFLIRSELVLAMDLMGSVTLLMVVLTELQETSPSVIVRARGAKRAGVFM